MLAVRKWAEDKPLILAIAAPQVATLAQDVHLAFKDPKSRKLLNFQFPLPDLPTWFTLYRSHRKTSEFIRSLFEVFCSFGPDSLVLADSLLELSQQLQKTSGQEEVIAEFTCLAPNERNALLREVQQLWRSVFESSFQDIEDEVQEKPIDPAERDEFFDFVAAWEPVSSFYFLIAVPCWILYRESATRLYQWACRGKIDALDKLLRLDPLLIHDPAIGKALQPLRMRRKHKYLDLIEAVKGKPRGRVNSKRMKYSLAGLISAWSILLKIPLNEPQIRALFDAVSQDFHGTIDTELADTPDSFYKAIKRDREMWLALFESDRKK